MVHYIDDASMESLLCLQQRSTGSNNGSTIKLKMVLFVRWSLPVGFGLKSRMSRPVQAVES